ncbi:MAG: hypothetical protein WAW86_06435 [Gammaproteobacteria bacterium]
MQRVKFFDSEETTIERQDKTLSLSEVLSACSKIDQIDIDLKEIETCLKNGTRPYLTKEVIEQLTKGPLRYSPGKIIGLLDLLLKYGLDMNNPWYNGLFIFEKNILAYKDTILFRLLLEYGLTIRSLEQGKVEALVATLSENATTSLDHYVLAILQYQYHPKWILPIEAALEKAVDSMYEYAYLRSIRLSLTKNHYSTSNIEMWLEKALERIELIKDYADGTTLFPIYHLLILTLDELNQQVVHEKLGDLIIKGIMLLNQHLPTAMWLPAETKLKMENLNLNPLPSLQIMAVIPAQAGMTACKDSNG